MITDNDPPPPYQTEDPLAATATLSQRVSSILYHIYRSHFGNYKIDLDDKTPAFYVQTRSLRTPNLIIHRGSGDIDWEVAHCKYPELANYYNIGIFRNPNDRPSLVWTKMTSDLRFEAIVPVLGMTGVSTASVSVRRSFIWKRTPSLTLVDEETGLTTAIVHEIGFASRKCCMLEIRVPYGDTFNLLVVATTIAMYERQRKEYSKHSGSSTTHHAAGVHVTAFSGALAGDGSGGGA
jgi:hypothetical protein